MTAPRTCPTCGRDYPADRTVCPRDGATLVGVDDGTFVRDPLLGQTVGEYRVERRIGAGGMGIVYEAVHPVIGKRAAVKVLRPEVAEDPEQMARLLSEAKAIASISHQSVIGIFGFGRLPDGRHYMVMEYLDGEPLDLLLQRAGKLPLEDVLFIIEQIAGALGAAHAVGVVHRDLKPSNVQVLTHADGTRGVKVLDFGLAKAGRPHEAIPQTTVGRVLGTPEYMAPEQARGFAVGPQTDLYALGVLAFELAVGDVPFTGPSPMEVMLRQVKEPPPKPSSRNPALPAAFDTLVERLLAKAPEDRPASADDVRQLVAHVRHPVLTGRPRPSRPRASAEHSRPAPVLPPPPARLAEGTEPGGQPLPLPEAPLASPPSSDATQRELPFVRGTTEQVPSQAAAPRPQRVLQERPLRKPARNASEDLSGAETFEIQNPTRRGLPVVLLGLVVAVVLGILAWSLWPHEPRPDASPGDLVRPLSVDPQHARSERAPGPVPGEPPRPAPVPETPARSDAPPAAPP